MCEEEYKLTCKIKLRIGTNANFGFWEEFLSLNRISSDAVLAKVAVNCYHGFHAEQFEYERNHFEHDCICGVVQWQ